MIPSEHICTFYAVMRAGYLGDAHVGGGKSGWSVCGVGKMD